MGEINISHDEQDALKAIDVKRLDTLIEQSLQERRPTSLRVLGLESCGTYVAAQFRAFESAVSEYSAAKATKKITETEAHARRAGRDLVFALHQMKHRVEKEERERQLFYIEDDLIMSPHRLSEHLTVRVSYRWRAMVEHRWQYGNITFTHDADLRTGYTIPPSKRKPSARKQEQDRQDKLYREWEHLKQLGLHSVRDFFRAGGNPTSIPETFQAKADSYTRRLNNFSAQFWSGHAQTTEQMT